MPLLRAIVSLAALLLFLAVIGLAVRQPPARIGIAAPVEITHSIEPHPSTRVVSSRPPIRLEAPGAESVRTQLEQILQRLEATEPRLDFESEAIQLQELVNRLTPAQLSQAFFESLELEGAHPTSASRDLQLRVTQRLAEWDPQQAARCLAQSSRTNLQEQTARVAAIWGKRHRGEALAWARDLPPEQQPAALLTLAEQMITDQPSEALNLAAGLDGSRQSGLLARAAAAWAGADLQAARTWAEQIEQKELRTLMLTAVAVQLARQDPETGARMLLENTLPGPAQERALIGIVQRYALKDPQAAREWVARFPQELKQLASMELARITERRRTSQ